MCVCVAIGKSYSKKNLGEEKFEREAKGRRNQVCRLIQTTDSKLHIKMTPDARPVFCVDNACQVIVSYLMPPFMRLLLLFAL